MRKGKAKKNSKKVFKTQKQCKKMKNIFDKLMSSLDTADKRVSELEDTTMETSKTERYREKKNEK